MTMPVDAKAAPVGNPGYFDFLLTGDFHLGFGGSTWNFAYAGYTDWFGAELDGAGNATDVDGSFSSAGFPVLGGQYTAQLLLQSATYGSVDVPGKVLDFNVTARVRFTWTPTGGGTSTCMTSNFTFDMTTRNESFCEYDESTGEFCLSGDGFTVPTLAPTACGGAGSNINSHFGLGAAAGHIFMYNVFASPIITQ